MVPSFLKMIGIEKLPALDPMTVLRRLPQRLVNRLLAPKTETACWLWLGAKNKGGYGHMWFQGRLQYVHRIAHEQVIGPIPEGMVVDHLCNTRLCANPSHLIATTHRDNILRGTGFSARNAIKTHCRNGHRLAGDNLSVYSLKHGRRICRICQNQTMAEAWRTKRFPSMRKHS